MKVNCIWCSKEFTPTVVMICPDCVEAVNNHRGFDDQELFEMSSEAQTDFDRQFAKMGHARKDIEYAKSAISTIHSSMRHHHLSKQYGIKLGNILVVKTDKGLRRMLVRHLLGSYDNGLRVYGQQYNSELKPSGRYFECRLFGNSPDAEFVEQIEDWPGKQW